jgi:PAS domain-containing protein
LAFLEQYIKAIEKNNIVSKTDINGVITFVNEEFCKISKYSKNE